MNVVPLLVEKGLVSPGDSAGILEEVAHGTPIEQVLEKRGVSIADMLGALGEKYHLPTRVLAEGALNEEALAYIPEESARHYRFVPLAVEDGALVVGIVDPDNIEALDALHFISTKVGMPYKLFIISERDFNKVIDEYQNLTGEVGEALSELDSSAGAAADGKKRGSDVGVSAPDEAVPTDTSVIKADAPVTKIVATILRYAVEGGASDIHIEPTPEKTRVRFRMDGDLHTSLELPFKVHQSVVARIKILASIRLDEKRKPQDGRFSAKVEKRQIDFRISTFPTEYGEKVVMRILDRSKSTATLESVGLSGDNLATLRDMLKAPYGMILISGPTGSGKSTTLFAMLSELDRETQNVVSLEDPVEYEIPGVSQSQVKEEIGYTFASGLRSILRQDPDIIMVGEIRDKETAQLAVQAALTGHLVLSTIHTNTAAGVVPRLIDMGVDPYLIAPTLIAAVGQRLVRTLCPGAGVPMPISESMQAYLTREFQDLPEKYREKFPPFKQFYKAVPTPECPNGTRGRTAAFEILRMDKDLEHVILTTPVEEKVYAAARSKGLITMREDAILKALAGEIPFEEVNTLGGELFLEEKEGAA